MLKKIVSDKSEMIMKIKKLMYDKLLIMNKKTCHAVEQTKDNKGVVANKAVTNEIPIHQPHPSFQNHFSMEQEAFLESDPDHLPYQNFQYLPPALYQELFVPHVHQSAIQGYRDHCPLLQHTVSLNLQLLY